MYSPKRKLRLKTRLETNKSLYWDVLGTVAKEHTMGYEWGPNLHGAIRARSVSKLMTLADSFVATVYATAAEHFAANQLAALIRKYPFSNDELPGLDPKGSAIRKFHAAEHHCKWVNRRFRALRTRVNPHNEIFRLARSWITRVLGDKPELSVIYGKSDFCAGASLGVHGNRTNLGRKLLSKSWTCTPSALPYALGALWSNDQVRELILAKGPIYCIDPEVFLREVQSKVKLVDYNNISFVPKTTKTDRSIAVEPLLNGFVQKGVDRFIRNRLAVHGFDLSDQTRNQRLAYKGSLDVVNPYATIDLSSASDSISIELVKELLPPEWFELLDSLRSPAFRLGDNKTHRYEKFVSMGNGFCFPLETLIFAALSRATMQYYKSPVDLAVYGDDIIVRQSIALAVLEILKYAGFTTNTEKTFVFGPFRESCGADWYGGTDVRPVYWDNILTDVREVFALHNSTYRSERSEMFFDSVRPILRSQVPSTLNYQRIGKAPGDTCFSVPFDVFMSCAHTKWVRHEYRWSWKEILSLPVRDKIDDPSANFVEYIAFLRGSSSSLPLAVRRMTRTTHRWI